MNTLAASLLTILIIIAGTIVLNTMVDSLGESATRRGLEVSPVYIEEVRKGFLIARNLGTKPAEVDTLYIFTPYGDRLLASYKYSTSYRIDPGESVEIPIPSSLWGTAPYAAPVRYVLGESQGSISALKGPFLPQGGVILGLFIPNGNTSVWPLLGGVGSVYVAGLYFNQTDSTMYMGLSYYDPDRKIFSSVAVPLFNTWVLSGLMNNDISYIIYSSLKMQDDKIMIAGAYLDAQNPLVYTLVDLKTLKTTIYGVTTPTTTSGAASFSPLPFMNIASLYHDERTGRVYLSGFANITTATGANVRANIIGYIEPTTGNVKLKALWNPAGGPVFAYNISQLPLYSLLPQHTFPQILVVGDRVFVRGVMDLGGQYAEAILVLDRDLNQASNLIFFNNIIVAPGFSTMVARDGKVYYVGLASTLPTAEITFPGTGFGTAPVIVEVPPSPFIAVIDARTLSVEKVLAYNGWTCNNILCTPRALAVGDGRLYLVIHDENTAPPTFLQGIKVSEQYFYLAEIDRKTLTPLKMVNMTIYVNNTMIIFNDYTLTLMGVHSASYYDEHLILNIIAFTALEGADFPEYAGEMVVGFRPELLEAEANRGEIILKDPVSGVNTTIKIHGVTGMPTNSTIASRVLGNITIIDLTNPSVTVFETAEFTASVQELTLPTLTTAMVIPLVFDFEGRGSPLEAKGLKIPLPNPPPPIVPVPIQPAPNPPPPLEPITINVTISTTNIGG